MVKHLQKKNNLYRHKKHFCYNNNIQKENNEKIYTATEVKQTLSEMKEEIKKDIELEHQKILMEFKSELKCKDVLILELRKEIGVLLTQKGNIYTTNNLVINPFGKENTHYISKEYINKLVQNGPMNCIPNLLEYIHFNPKHIENHNIKIPNKKENFAQVYNGDQWEYQDKKQTIENMTDKAFGIINEHYDEGTNQYMDKIKNKIEESEKITVKKIHKDTEIMILNNQNKIKKK